MESKHWEARVEYKPVKEFAICKVIESVHLIRSGLWDGISISKHNIEIVQLKLYPAFLECVPI